VTINKVCGSGLKAVMLAAQSIRAGDAEIVVAGGMESMSNVPYLLPQARTGYRLGNGALVDGLVHDGLWDPYNNFHMGSAGELCARECQIPRDRQDAYAAESYRRAQAAVKEGKFRDEIAAVQVPSRKGPRPRSSTTSSRSRATRTSSPAYAPPSTRTARSRRATPRRSTTAPRPWW
jgi:acetyl-CoA C-acetyltransferase